MTRLSAAQAASNALNQLKLDQSEPIDPFEAIEEAGLELRFRPLATLLGAVLPGEPGGILINSARPASLQRYTAAHELGHWYMDQDILSVDTDEAILGHHHQEAREIDAQVFAAHFLMPLELLYPIARRYGIRQGVPADAQQVYQAARDMHVSYEAAVRQLNTTKFISLANRDQLLLAKPALIKKSLTDGMILPNARGDVWIIEHPSDRAEIRAVVGDAILLRLTEYPATGYRWCAEEALADASVQPLRPAPEPFEGGRAFGEDVPSGHAEIIPFPTASASSDVVTLIRDEVRQETYQPGVTSVGGAVTRLVAYAATAPGEESIRLNQVRLARVDAPVSRLEVTTSVRGLPEAEFRNRLLEAFKRDEEDGEEWDH